MPPPIKTMKEDTPENNFLQTIESPNLIKISSDAAELTLDQMLDQGLLRDIPIFGCFVNFIKAGLDIKNYLFLKKVYSFLSHFKDIPEKKRIKFVEELKGNDPFRKKIGQNLLLVLDKLNDMSKPDMLGRVFKAYIEEEIDFLNLSRLSNAIEKINIHDISFLVSYYSGQEKVDNSVEDPRQALTNCGLLMLFPSASIGGGGFFYKRNNLGELFIKVALSEDI